MGSSELGRTFSVIEGSLIRGAHSVQSPTFDQRLNQLPSELRQRVERLPANLQARFFNLPPYLKVKKACEERADCSRGFLWERAGKGKLVFVKSGEAANAPTLVETLSLLEDMAAMAVVPVKRRHRKKPIAKTTTAVASDRPAALAVDRKTTSSSKSADPSAGADRAAQDHVAGA